MLGKNYHAIRINYLKDKMNNMVGGRFGTRKGGAVVIITHDPVNPSVNRKDYQCFQLTSPKGRFYKPLIEEYLSIKNQYDQLVNEWNYLYGVPVPTVQLPINANPGPHNMTYDKFLRARAYQNPAPIKKPFHYKKEILRSRNEGHIIEKIDAKHIPYKVEPEIPIGMELMLGRNSRYPDAICGLIEINRSFYLEVVGGLQLPGYKESNHTKFLEYEEAGYRDMRDFITIYITDEWDDEYIETKLNAAIDLMCPQII